MSVNYDIEERIAIDMVTEDNRDFVEMVAGHIISIGERSLSGQTKINRFKVQTGSEEFNLSADSSIAYWARCGKAVSECDSLKMFSDYGYVWKLDLADYDNVGPFELMEYAGSQGENFLASILYEEFSYADCNSDGDGCGIYCAYGYKDGQKYCGKVPFKKIAALPEGEWYTPDTPLTIEDDFTDKVQFDEIVSACRNIDTLCYINEKYPNLRVHGSKIEYFLNNPFIRSEHDADVFARNLAVYLRTIDEESLEVCFWDNDRMNMIKLIVNADGTYRSEIAML